MVTFIASLGVYCAGCMLIHSGYTYPGYTIVIGSLLCDIRATIMSYKTHREIKRIRGIY